MLFYRFHVLFPIGVLFLVGTSFNHEINSRKNVGAFCANDTSQGDPNLNPIDDSPPELIRTVENGSLYTIGTGEDQFWLVHVWGNSGYDYGFAYGTLLKEQIRQMQPIAWAHFEQKIIDELDKLKLPKWFEDIVASKGLAFALDFQNTLVEAYIDKEIYQEMRGIADAANVDYVAIRRLHMLGEITRGRCSLYGLWGNATLQSKTLQLRALDWDTQGGYIATLTGMSSTRLGISEIGIYFSDNTFGDESMSGLPFIFVERHILQFMETLDDALSFIANVKRTCHLVLAIGDGKLATARMIQYSHSRVNFFDDENLQPLADWHPRIPNAVYCGMDWLCPSHQYKLYKQIIYQYGQITPESSIRNITSVVKTGELHIGLYDLTDNIMYVANARGTNETGPLEAYQRQFVKIDLNIEFARVQ
ncbi:unnamed protein product [Rotaria sordida]|uniref:Uncharacterized protein n=3 Tax=Rotaria sordida TaxID=392033 RepID=A0A818QHW1_9BILA|nr:unnamed protein product [Rotaria sordida]